MTTQNTWDDQADYAAPVLQAYVNEDLMPVYMPRYYEDSHIGRWMYANRLDSKGRYTLGKLWREYVWHLDDDEVVITRAEFAAKWRELALTDRRGINCGMYSADEEPLRRWFFRTIDERLDS